MSTSGKPLEGMKFVIVGDKFGMDKKEMKNKIKELGGEVASKVEKNTAAVITTADHIGGTNKKIDAAKEHNIQCVSDDFLEEVEKGGALLMIQKKNLAPWGGDPQDRVHASKSSSKSKFGKDLCLFPSFYAHDIRPLGLLASPVCQMFQFVKQRA
ncbi:DNA ligase-like [Penaeus monodon]|uniref:DNA ligase-like n=1 Tax=Penaeus monodon TaxID=6687 RepID=UPI0018A7A536|nr:DNA ligase-like [Penaeus monodon]